MKRRAIQDFPVTAFRASGPQWFPIALQVVNPGKGYLDVEQVRSLSINNNASGPLQHRSRSRRRYTNSKPRPTLYWRRRAGNDRSSFEEIAIVRASTIVMIGFAVLFGLLAVFVAQSWLTSQADARMKSLEAQKRPLATQTIVVASQAAALRQRAQRVAAARDSLVRGCAAGRRLRQDQRRAVARQARRAGRDRGRTSRSFRSRSPAPDSARRSPRCCTTA